MLIAYLTGVATCALAQNCDVSQRSFYLREPYSQMVARLASAQNQAVVYEACDSSLLASNNDLVQFYPPPFQVVRRTKLAVRLPLRQVEIECRERVEVTSSKMTIRASLTGCHWKVRRLELVIELSPSGPHRTKVTTAMNLNVNGFGHNFGWLLADVTLSRLESGLRRVARRRK